MEKRALNVDDDDEYLKCTFCDMYSLVNIVIFAVVYTFREHEERELEG